MYCFDHTGKELWKRVDLGKCGPNDPKGRNYLLAVNKRTGETAWEQDQTYGSWSTPLIATVGGQDHLLLGHSRREAAKTGYLRGFDPKTGKEIWKCQGMNSFVYTSALYANGVAVGMSGYGGSALAVKLGNSGDITKDRLWKHQRNFSITLGVRLASGAA